MASDRRVAVVTGSNKGIGFGVVKALCQQFDGDVFLTARNEANGAAAVKKLEDEGLAPKFHQLDITDRVSIERLKSFLEKNYGGLDVLVNNAGIAYKEDATDPLLEQTELTLRCNFWGTLDVCNILFPLLRPHARVVNVSSQASILGFEFSSETRQAQLIAPDIAMKDVEELMKDFVNSVKNDTIKESGWLDKPYFISKIGVTLMSSVQQKLFNKDYRPDLIVNSCCPGYVVTDMTEQKGIKTIDEGADTPVYLATLPPNTATPKGEFVFDRKFKPWPKYSLQDYPEPLRGMMKEYGCKGIE